MAGLAQAVMWHRQASALALAADRVGVGGDQLPAIQARIVGQRSALIAAGAAEVVPTPTEVSAAMPALGNLSAAAVAAALQAVTTTLDAADAALQAAPVTPTVLAPPLAPPPSPLPVPPLAPPAVVTPPASAPGQPAPALTPAPTGITTWRPGLRNALVYGGYSFTVLVVQLLLLVTADEEKALPQLAPVCLGVLPAFAWAAGWLTIGVAFRPGPDGKRVARTPRLGAIVCLLPNLTLCAGVGVLYLLR